MESANQVVEGTVADAGGALKRLMVGTKVLRAKKTFLTALEAFRGTSLYAMVCYEDHPCRFVNFKHEERAKASGLALAKGAVAFYPLKGLERVRYFRANAGTASCVVHAFRRPAAGRAGVHRQQTVVLEQRVIRDSYGWRTRRGHHHQQWEQRRGSVATEPPESRPFPGGQTRKGETGQTKQRRRLRRRRRRGRRGQRGRWEP